MTVAQRDGVLTIANGRLRFTPEVYPVEHLRNEGWRKEPDGSWTATATSQSLVTIKRLFPSVEWEGQWPGFSEPFPQPQTAVLRASTPESWGRLYPYQQRAAQWLAERRSALLCLAPGLGKSAVALTALQMATPHRNLQAVIVCPLTLIGTWQEQVARWYPDAAVVVHHGDMRQGSVSLGLARCGRAWQGGVLSGKGRVAGVSATLHFLTYDGLRRNGLPMAQPDVLILDESVLVKNRLAARTKAAAKARRQAGIAWELTGSPCTRFLDDLYAQVATLDPKQYSSYWRFTTRYCLVQSTVWGKNVVANAPGAEERVKQELQGIAHFYNYTDLAREEPERAIPEWVFETRQVPLPEKWWKLYKQMQDKFMVDLPDGARILAPNTLARLVRLLQFASHPALLIDTRENPCAHCGGKGYLPGDAELLDCPHCPVEGGPQDFAGYDWGARGGKLSAIPELLDELPGPTIVWTNFIATAKHLSETLKAPCLIGETPAEERTRIVAAFQAGQHPVLIAHPGVGRFGLTLTAGRSMIFAERSHNADYYLQALYRCRRIGTTEPPQVVILEATGPHGEASIDRAISRVLSYRKDRSEQLTTALLKETLQ